MVTAVAKVVAKVEKLREEEHSAYVPNKADMEAGLEGVKMALEILREYYATEGKAHEAAEGAGSGIVGLLEVCESDFSKGLAEMIAVEEKAAADYDSQTKENAIVKVTKEQDLKYKTKESAELDTAVTETTAYRESVQTELDSILEYLEKLKDQR